MDATTGQQEGNGAAPLAEAPAGYRAGRKPGSKNKIGKEAREVLAQHGPAVFVRLCRIALGMAVYNHPEARGGTRVKRIFSDADQMAAAKLVVERLVPALKATELSGPGGDPLLPSGPPNYVETSKSILEILARAVPGGGNVAVTEPGEHTATFRDPDLGRRLDLGEPASVPPTPAERTGPGPHIIDGKAVVGFNEGNGKWFVCSVANAAVLEWHPSLPAAVARARELIKAKPHMFPQ